MAKAYILHLSLVDNVNIVFDELNPLDVRYCIFFLRTNRQVFLWPDDCLSIELADRGDINADLEQKCDFPPEQYIQTTYKGDPQSDETR